MSRVVHFVGVILGCVFRATARGCIRRARVERRRRAVVRRWRGVSHLVNNAPALAPVMPGPAETGLRALRNSRFVTEPPIPRPCFFMSASSLLADPASAPQHFPEAQA